MRALIGGLAAIALVLPTVAARADAYDAALSQAIVAKEKAAESNAPVDWEAALRAMQTADAIRPTAETRYELGTIAAKLRADDLAFEMFESALARGLLEPARDKAETFVREHRALLGALRVRGPAGARIVILQRERATLPHDAPIVVFAGTVEITIVRDGGSSLHHATVTAGAVVDVDLVAEAPAPATALPLSPQPTSAPTTTFGWPLVGVGGAIVGGSVIVVVIASAVIPHHRDAIVELCPPEKLDGDRCTAAPADKRDAISDHRSALLTWSALRTGGYVGLGVGAVVALIGGLRLATAERPKSAWAPVIRSTPTAWLVGLEGAF